MGLTRLYHSGIATFMGAPACSLKDLQPGAFAAVGVPYDYACGSRPGARWGPRAVRQSSLYFDYFLRSGSDKEYVDISTGRIFASPDPGPVVDLGDIEVFPMDVERTMASISSFISQVTQMRATPLIIGGDHFVTFPSFCGYTNGASSMGMQVNDIAYVHVDSHLDMFDDNPAWGKFYHGSTVRRIAELDGMDPRNVLLIGIHGLVGKATYEFIQKKGINLVTLKEINSNGLERALSRPLEQLVPKVKSIYLSIDIDAVNCAFAPGTGGISLEGMTPGQLLTVVGILNEFPIGAVDVVEVAPNYDLSERTQRLAAEVFFNFLIYKGGVKGD